MIIVESHTSVVDMLMSLPKLTKLELQIMEALWNGGALSIREIQEAFPEKGRPAYTTIQTTVYRLEVREPPFYLFNDRILSEYVIDSAGI